MNCCNDHGANQPCTDHTQCTEASTLHTHNSDGSDPTASPPATWLDELYYWGLIAALTCAFTGLLALTAGYVISR